MNMKNRVVLAGIMAISPSVWAHPGHETASFAHGFLHPLTGADHLLALLLIGLFSAAHTRRVAAKSVALVLVALSLGFVAGIEWVNTGYIETLVMASLLLLPVSFVALRRSSVLKAVALVAIAVFSMCHGIVQGAESQGALLQYGLGTLLASALVIGGTFVVAKALRHAVSAARRTAE